MKEIVFPIQDPSVILQCIPQRMPMVMVDAVYAYTDTHLTAGLTVNEANFFIRNDELTEPGLIEHMAQSVALHTGFQYFIKNTTAPAGYIGSINMLEITALPKVQDTIFTEVEILQEFMGVTLVNIVSAVNSEVIARSQMKTVIAR